MIHIKGFCFNALQERCYAVWEDSSQGSCVLVDPGCLPGEEFSRLTDYLDSEGRVPEAILLTHGHFDHIYGVAGIRDRYGAVPVWLHRAERPVLAGAGQMAYRFGLPVPDTSWTFDFVTEGCIVTAAGLAFHAILTPGHSPGGVCWYVPGEKVLFSGDTLFAGSIGRTDFPGGDLDLLLDSILNRLMPLPGDTAVLPGHGEETEIAAERAGNPFLRPFDETGEDTFSFFKDFS